MKSNRIIAFSVVVLGAGQWTIATLNIYGMLYKEVECNNTTLDCDSFSLLYRARFESQSSSLIPQCMQPIEQVLAQANLQKDDIHKVRTFLNCRFFTCRWPFHNVCSMSAASILRWTTTVDWLFLANRTQLILEWIELYVDRCS